MNFNVEYVLRNGEKRREIIKAESALEIEKKLPEDGKFVVSVIRAASDEVSAGSKVIDFFAGPSNFEVMLFTRELNTLIKAGLTIPEALDIIERHISNGRFKASIVDIKNMVVSGRSFAEAVADKKDIFSELYSKCVRGGEAASDLPGVLEILGSSLKKIDAMRSKIFNMLVYPAVIITIVFLVFSFLVFYVVPSFESVFYEMKIEVPPYTKALFAAGAFLKNFWLYFVLLPPAALFAMIFWGTSKQAKDALLKAALKFPWIGNILESYLLFIFTGMFSIMLKSGIKVIDALETGLAALAPVSVKNGCEAAIEALKGGESLSDSVLKLGLKNDVVVRMISVGEKSGRVPEMMETINEYYSEYLENNIERMAAVMEPLIILIVGLFIAAIVLSIFLPIVRITMSGF